MQTWRAVGLSDTLRPRDVRASRVDGVDVVVWRQASGKAHVWRNQCPHRGMRLSFGCVRDDTLACMYHGWRFAGSGACQQIPAQPDFTPPATLHSEPLACKEEGGFVWAAVNPELDGPTPVDGTTPATNAQALMPVHSTVVGVSAAHASTVLATVVFRPFSAANLLTGSRLTRQDQPGNDGRKAHTQVQWHLAGGESPLVTYQHESTDDLVSVTASHEDVHETMTIAIQPLQSEQVMLHLRAGSTAASKHPSDFRRHAFGWLKHIRWFLEHPQESAEPWLGVAP